jgi:hypothetical protein
VLRISLNVDYRSMVNGFSWVCYIYNNLNIDPIY